MLIEYEDIVQLLELDIKDKEFDELCLNASYAEIERSLGYSLEEKECCEILTVRDNRIILDAISTAEVIEITDITTKREIEYFTVDYENKSIYFVPSKTDGHIMFVNYKAGFTKETIPADLKEAIIKMFLHKQNELRKAVNNENTEVEYKLPDDINETVRRYERKCL